VRDVLIINDDPRTSLLIVIVLLEAFLVKVQVTFRLAQKFSMGPLPDMNVVPI
jgi:hypothetical protein